jgi:hypothetical protein
LCNEFRAVDRDDDALVIGAESCLLIVSPGGEGVSSGVGSRRVAESNASVGETLGRAPGTVNRVLSRRGWRVAAGVAASKTADGMAENESSQVSAGLDFAADITLFGPPLAGVAASSMSGAMLENESSMPRLFLRRSFDTRDFLAGVAASRTSGGILENESFADVFWTERIFRF